MNNEVLVLITSILSASIGAFGVYVSALFNRKHDSVKNDAVRAASEVISYHRLERLYAEKLAEMSNESFRIVLIRMRSLVESEGLYRPTMTPRKAKEIINRWK